MKRLGSFNCLSVNFSIVAHNLFLLVSLCRGNKWNHIFLWILILFVVSSIKLLRSTLMERRQSETLLQQASLEVTLASPWGSRQERDAALAEAVGHIGQEHGLLTSEILLPLVTCAECLTSHSGCLQTQIQVSPPHHH